MSNTTYKAGDRVVITGNTDDFHNYKTGTVCEIVGFAADHPGHYLLTGFVDVYGANAFQHVPPSDFRPAESSYSLQEYRDRVPTNSEGWEGGHTEQGI